MIEHLVLFQAVPGREDEVSDACRGFVAAIAPTDGVLDSTWGRNTNPGSLRQGWTHALHISIADQAAFDDHYRPHPARAAFAEHIDPLCSAGFAIDFLPESIDRGE